MPEDTAIEAQIVELAPVEKTPKYDRESFLRPPDWRYIAAQEYLREEKAGRVAQPAKDAAVQYLVRVLRGISNQDSRQVVMNKWRDVADVIHIGTAARESFFSQELENFIINGITAEEVEKEIGSVWFTAKHYLMFQSFFFDLSGVCTITAWINHHLLEPAIKGKQGALLRNRLLAYCEGKNAALDAMSPDYKHSKSEILRTFSTTTRQRKIFDYLVERTNLPPEVYANMMEAAIKDINSREFQERLKDKETAGTSSLQELAGDLSEGVRRFTLDEQQKYDPFGLDYSNRYTSIILDKGPDNGADNKPQ